MDSRGLVGSTLRAATAGVFEDEAALRATRRAASGARSTGGLLITGGANNRTSIALVVGRSILSVGDIITAKIRAKWRDADAPIPRMRQRLDRSRAPRSPISGLPSRLHSELSRGRSTRLGRADRARNFVAKPRPPRQDQAGSVPEALAGAASRRRATGMGMAGVGAADTFTRFRPPALAR